MPARRKKTTSGQFRVANPRKRPKGKDYLKVGTRKYWPGEVFDVSSDRVNIDDLLKRRVLVEE